MEPPRPPAEPKAHLYSLDALRGLAALAVVVYHWQHFLWHGSQGGGLDFAQFPFPRLLTPLYHHGWRAVSLFFTLSGFIFYWLYAGKVAAHGVGAGRFAWFRFSRLYPLHLATLVLMAVLQWAYFRAHGAFFVNEHEDLPHFLIQLLLVTSWWPSHVAFNGVVWSIGVEVWLYALFFLLCRRGLTRWWQLLLFCLAGYLVEILPLPVVGHSLASIGVGMFWFFLGGLACYAWQALERSRWPRWAQFAAVVGAALLAVVLIRLRDPVQPVAYQAYAALGVARLFPQDGAAIGEWLLAMPRLSIAVALFPLTLIGLALVESTWRRFGPRLSILGQLSYSSYLLHFPLQLIFAGSAKALGFPQTVFLSPAVFIGYFALLIVLSVLCFRCFEYPAQQWLRRRIRL